MGASVRTAYVVVVLLLLACWGPPLSAQSPNPVPFINDPLVPTSAAPGGPGFTLTLNWHRLCFGFGGQLERNSAHNSLRKQFPADRHRSRREYRRCGYRSHCSIQSGARWRHFQRRLLLDHQPGLLTGFHLVPNRFLFPRAFIELVPTGNRRLQR